MAQKNVEKHSFEGNVDTDTADELLEPNKARFLQNVRVSRSGKKGVVTNIMGNTLIANALPAGNNVALGYGKNEERGKLYYFNYNDQGYHGIYVYDLLTRSISPVIRNLIDTNNVDILKFSPDYLINHIDIIQDNLIYWVDGLNKARKFNITKAMDKSSAGYGTVILEDFITAYKQTGIYAASVNYFTDINRQSNYLYGKQFKFCYRFYYDDNEISNWSDWSAVPLPPNESYLGVNAITYDNNGIYVGVETGGKLVKKIEISVKITDTAGIVEGGLDWVSCAVLNKSELNINDSSIYTFVFFNDGSYTTIDQSKVIRAFSYMPRAPFAQSFVNIAMTYTNADEGFPAVPVNAKVDISFQPFYLPSGTISQLNNPAFINNTVSTNSHGGLFNTWWTSIVHFEVGQDVKKGNHFSIEFVGGTALSDSSGFVYTAKIGDNASIVASKIKQYLRGIAAVGDNLITNETIDGSGNVTWDLTIEAHEGLSPFKFFTSVNKVNYATLLDNGLSVNTIKQGSNRKYAFIYFDDDGRISLAYTQDELLVRTPFETEKILGQVNPIGLQQPIHKVSIYHQPPIWAKYWALVRTSDITSFIQMLIQQVTVVKVANQDTYLDLIVGSLFTYQKIHPETILKYEFQRGDRLRLIAKYDPDTQIQTPYTPYFETEVLSYKIDTEEFVNANIITDGTDHVQPDKAVDAGYIGKNIVINNIERQIVGIDGSKYVLDKPINGDGYGSPFSALTFPNYTFVDRRGIIRIKKPLGYTITDFSKVEIYHPEKNNNNADYQMFFDFQQKFEVANWGKPNRAHKGTLQDQDGTNSASLISTPAIVQITQGDAYVRNRALPSSNTNPNPQVIIDRICDPNFSDFYQSNLYNLGRVFPQDQAYGVVKFPSRTRFSNNYIKDTQINGLNDFNSNDRVDYNDPYGSVTLTRFRRGYLFYFKELKTAWGPVGKKIIRDNAGSETLATSDNLLNDLSYAVWEGGIGNNGESWMENGNAQYYASKNSGVFIRVAQDGSIPISQLYFYDKRAREILELVNKYNLRIPGDFDRKNDEALWSIPTFKEFLFDNDFIYGDWDTAIDSYPDGTTFTITQQPANSTANIVGNQIQITDTSVLGSDFFKFQGNLPGGGTTPIKNFCFSVVEEQNRPVSYRVRESSLYCDFVYGNDERTQVFTRNNCGPGFIGSNVPYTVPANRYTALNQAAADALAQADIDANGQNYANNPAHGTCTPETVYSSVEKSGTFQKNCSAEPGTAGTYVQYIVPAGTYTSTVSQAAADAQAQADVDANGQAYANSHGSCIVSSKKGTFLIDFYDDSSADLCFYCDTVGVAESGIPVTARANNGGAGVARYPNDGRDPATCYLLSSDRLLLSSSVKMRFGVNMAYFIAQYPAIDHFKFVMRGRTLSSGACNGLYALRDVSQGYLAMVAATGEPSKFIPTVIGASPSSTTYSSNISSGADGTTGVGVGSPVLQLDYIVSTDSFTITTF